MSFDAAKIQKNEPENKRLQALQVVSYYLFIHLPLTSAAPQHFVECLWRATEVAVLEQVVGQRAHGWSQCAVLHQFDELHIHLLGGDALVVEVETTHVEGIHIPLTVDQHWAPGVDDLSQFVVERAAKECRQR